MYNLPGTNNFFTVCERCAISENGVACEGKEPECEVIKFTETEINKAEGYVKTKISFNEVIDEKRMKFYKKRNLNKTLMVIKQLPTKEEEPIFSKEYFVIAFKGFRIKTYLDQKVKVAIFQLTKRVHGSKYNKTDVLDCWWNKGLFDINKGRHVIIGGIGGFGLPKYYIGKTIWGTVDEEKLRDKAECERVIFEDVKIDNIKDPQWVEATIKIADAGGTTERGVAGTQEEGTKAPVSLIKIYEGKEIKLDGYTIYLQKVYKYKANFLIKKGERELDCNDHKDSKFLSVGVANLGSSPGGKDLEECKRIKFSNVRLWSTVIPYFEGYITIEE